MGVRAEEAPVARSLLFAASLLPSFPPSNFSPTDHRGGETTFHWALPPPPPPHYPPSSPPPPPTPLLLRSPLLLLMTAFFLQVGLRPQKVPLRLYCRFHFHCTFLLHCFFFSSSSIHLPLSLFQYSRRSLLLPRRLNFSASPPRIRHGSERRQTDEAKDDDGGGGGQAD